MVLLVMLLTAAVFDVLYRRIPNWLTVSGVVLGLAMNTLIGAPEAGLVFSLIGLAGRLSASMRCSTRCGPWARATSN